MKKILTKDELQNLAEQIGEIEKKTAAEIRVVVHHKKHWSERKLSARQVAEREFGVLNMAKTKKGTGILVFILVSERQFELLADHGVIAVLPEEFWTNAAQKLSGHFSRNNFYDGLKAALAEIGEVLETKLPPIAGEQSELPNDVVED
ncbi:MAG TPA: TPM domain-containing protein [Candidatus Acidoferrales bacterium]|nr:TPM domain-containing protein [Candidatus Acidoferrales bacterium]